MNSVPSLRKDRINLLKSFLEKYDIAQNLNFNNIKFRPKAKRTTGFGIDITTPEYTPLRVHLAVDSSISSSTGYNIFAPFDFSSSEYKENYLTFGTLLILYTNFGFQLRIAHIAPNNFSSKEMLERVRNKKAISANELIADCGSAGLSFGRHAHVELVSNENSFCILDDILEKKFSKGHLYHSYTDQSVQRYCDIAGLSFEEGISLYKKEYKKRSIQIVNDKLAYRVDYLTRKNRMFYNSMAVFGM